MSQRSQPSRVVSTRSRQQSSHQPSNPSPLGSQSVPALDDGPLKDIRRLTLVRISSNPTPESSLTSDEPILGKHPRSSSPLTSVKAARRSAQSHPTHPTLAEDNSQILAAVQQIIKIGALTIALYLQSAPNAKEAVLSRLTALSWLEPGISVYLDTEQKAITDLDGLREAMNNFVGYTLPTPDEFSKICPGNTLDGTLYATMSTSLLRAISTFLSLSAQKAAAAITKGPTPSKFGKPGGWKEWQSKPETAILCHRPINNIPPIPIQYLHPAFYSFLFAQTPAHAVPLEFYSAADMLVNKLNQATGQEATRVAEILTALQEIFPHEDGRQWILESKNVANGRLDLVYGIPLTSEYADRFASMPGHAMFSPLIVFEVKLEVGSSGDPFMQLARYYQLLTAAFPRCQVTGAPMFLVVAAGPNITFCGGWAGQKVVVESMVSIVLTGHGACRDQLAALLYHLKQALGRLPSCHTPATNLTSRFLQWIPYAFNSYVPLDQEAIQLPLTITETLTSDRRQRAFYANATSNGSDLRCVFKLTLGCYGEEVHKTLAEAGLAPKLLGYSSKRKEGWVMEHLQPPSQDTPGWVTLHDLAPGQAADSLDAIHGRIETILALLGKYCYVHGDLRRNNLMVKINSNGRVLNPVTIHVVDFDWSGLAGKVLYPRDLNPGVFYPGIPGGKIEQGHDNEMVGSWWNTFVDWVQERNV